MSRNFARMFANAVGLRNGPQQQVAPAPMQTGGVMPPENMLAPQTGGPMQPQPMPFPQTGGPGQVNRWPSMQAGGYAQQENQLAWPNMSRQRRGSWYAP